MQNFLHTAFEKAMSRSDHDQTPLGWAIRVFVVISLLGGLDEIGDKTGDQLASLLSMAPGEVVDGASMSLFTMLPNHPTDGEDK